MVWGTPTHCAVFKVIRMYRNDTSSIASVLDERMVFMFEQGFLLSGVWQPGKEVVKIPLGKFTPFFSVL